MPPPPASHDTRLAWQVVRRTTLTLTVRQLAVLSRATLALDVAVLAVPTLVVLSLARRARAARAAHARAPEHARAARAVYESQSLESPLEPPRSRRAPRERANGRIMHGA